MGRWLLAGLAAIGLAAGGWWVLPEGPEVIVEVPSGLGAAGTAALLRREGVIRSALLFRAWAKLSRLDRKLKPGRYALRRGMREPSALRALVSGDIQHSKVVIPEGFMAKQIADRLEANAVTPSLEFFAYVMANNLEGYLFPTTYLFSPGLAPQAVAHHMHEEFRRAVEPEVGRSGQKRFTLGQVVTLAAIVQREARRADEMPMIAGVYINRLARRMRLEADPTVQYALGRDTGEWERRLIYKDLAVASPYNTYQNFGLPPGPICSPGLDAVRAVLNPALTDALFFVADNKGGHVFSRTIEEHNRAVAKMRRELRGR